MLEISDVARTYGSGEKAVTAIGDLTFEVVRGEFLVIVGPSGCGKTTLLKCLAGLLAPTSGEARLAGRRVVSPPRELALVFQDYSRSLLPWLTRSQERAAAAEGEWRRQARAQQRAETALVSVGLGKFMDHYPWQLSGGMQQRAALARALAYGADILLMDEPFASVDAQTRADLEDLVMRIWRESGITVLFVTHDIDEAVYLADRIVVLSQPRPS